MAFVCVYYLFIYLILATVISANNRNVMPSQNNFQ